MVAVVHEALELGINLFDSAPAYGRSEEILGAGLVGVPREGYLLATKVTAVEGGDLVDSAVIDRSVERSLRRLGTDHLDIIQLHAVPPEHFSAAVDRLLPALLRHRDAGKVRFIGITEAPLVDHEHETLSRAVDHGAFDAVMVAYSLVHPNAGRSLLALAMDHGTGVIGMMATRGGLGRPATLERRLRDAKRRGIIADDALPDLGAVDWLFPGDGHGSLAANAYAFVAAHPAVATVLTGTADIDHLRDNVRAVLGLAPHANDVRRFVELFMDLGVPFLE